MSQSFLSRRTAFGLPTALVVLLIFFFLLPSAFRGARLAVAGKKNNIKDWLPSDFRETVELEWFASYFMGESFVVATWEGCTVDDQRLGMFSAKLRQESAQRSLPDTEDHRRARELAEELQLFIEPPALHNWGGLEEKWFSSPSGRSYYITPEGRLYRWEESTNAVSSFARAVRQAFNTYTPQGQFIAAFGEPSTRDSVNEFYNDPALLAASLFQTVETGNDLVETLASPGGPLWPIDLTDAEQREAVARSRAVERLTGILFAPAVPPDFDWSPGAVQDNIPERMWPQLPENFEAIVQRTVAQIEERLGRPLQDAMEDQQGAAWEELCLALGIPVPPRQTCVIVTLTPLARDHLARAVGRGVVGGPRGRLLILADQSGLGAAPPPSMAPPPFDRNDDHLAAVGGRTPLRLGGPPIDNVAIDEEGTVTLVRLVGYSGLVGLGLSFFCFRSFNLTIMIFMVGVSAAVLGLAITYWTGGNVDAILMSMPSLVYVLGLSGAIHVVNYYRDEVRLRGVRGAPERAARHAAIPCSLAAMTTSLGLISLCTSNIVPIYNFGLYAAAAVIATLLILFTYLPAALEIFVPSFAMRMVRAEDEAKADADKRATERAESEEEEEFDAFGGEPLPPPTPPPSLIVETWAGIGRFVTRHYTAVTVVCLTAFGIGLLGIPKIQTSVQLLKLFDSESRIIADYAYLEENFGKLVPMELVVRVPHDMIARRAEAGEPADADAPAGTPTDMHPLTLLQRMEAVARIDTAVRRTLGDAGTGVVGRTMNAATFLPPLPEPARGYTPVRGRFEAQLNASLDELAKSDFYRRERDGPFAGSELWRISLRVSALSDVDYGRFVGDLRQAVTPVLDAYRGREVILDALSAEAADEPAAVAARRAPQILMIGSDEPRRMSQEEFLAVDKNERREEAVTRAVRRGRQGELILEDRLYAAALADLMRGERIRRAIWLDLDSADAPIGPDSPQWQEFLDRFDLVVQVGDQQAVDIELLQRDAKAFVDVRRRVLPQAESILIDNVPAEKDAAPLQAIYTGIVPVVYKAQRTLLESLIESIVLAFFLIAAVMITLLTPGHFPRALTQPRVLACGVTAGMIAMIPNLFPVVVIFGFMGHSGTLVDIGTMMTASVAMGVAVDDTIHFLTWFRENIDKGLSRVEAVIETYRRVGPAMTQTTIVGGLGLFVFALSTFTPTQRFGTLMLVLLSAALVGDLILLPALLAGPLGRWFRPRPPRGLHPSPIADAEEDISGENDREEEGSARASERNGSSDRQRPQQAVSPQPSSVEAKAGHAEPSDAEETKVISASPPHDPAHRPRGAKAEPRQERTSK